MRDVHFRGITSLTYYVKPLPLTLPWLSDVIPGVENSSTGSFAFNDLVDDAAYEVFLQSLDDPSIADTPVGAVRASQVDLIDTPNTTAIEAIQAGLSRFDPATEVVTTDELSRAASRADVSGLATSAELLSVQQSCLTVSTDQIRSAVSGQWTVSGGQSAAVTITETE